MPAKRQKLVDKFNKNNTYVGVDTTNVFTVSSLKRAINDLGNSGIKIQQTAIDYLCSYFNSIATMYAYQFVLQARHANRKTVGLSDVSIVVENNNLTGMGVINVATRIRSDSKIRFNKFAPDVIDAVLPGMKITKQAITSFEEVLTYFLEDIIHATHIHREYTRQRTVTEDAVKHAIESIVSRNAPKFYL